MLIARHDYAALLRAHLQTFPAVAVLGPRQCGKSTLVREFVKTLPRRNRITVFDLERPSDLARLAAAPEEDLGALQTHPGVICIDEVQRAPALFQLLRVLIDQPQRRARYILLGSASPSLVTGVSETLAGRVGFIDLSPFLSAEVVGESSTRRQRLWLRGGYPPSFLARSEHASAEWRESYIRTFLEQDVPGLGLRLPALTLRRFWTMLAHVHGGVLNATELATALGVSVPTVGRYLDLLEGTYMIRRLPPYWANIGKRLVKSPKVYLRDSGVLHTLLGIGGLDGLRSHPKHGASWEGWVIEQVLGTLRLAGERVQPYFWRTHGGAEVDLLLVIRDHIVPIEIKLGAEPRVTRGLTECLKDLRVPTAFVLHGGGASFPLARNVWALSTTLAAQPAALRETLLRPSRLLGRAVGRDLHRLSHP
jgi:hypothetical protein